MAALSREFGAAAGREDRALCAERRLYRNWMSQADADDNGGAKLTSAEKKELAELRKKAGQMDLENEILKRAAAYFAQENMLPK